MVPSRDRIVLSALASGATLVRVFGRDGRPIAFLDGTSAPRGAGDVHSSVIGSLLYRGLVRRHEVSINANRERVERFTITDAGRRWLDGRAR